MIGRLAGTFNGCQEKGSDKLVVHCTSKPRLAIRGKSTWATSPTSRKEIVQDSEASRGVVPVRYSNSFGAPSPSASTLGAPSGASVEPNHFSCQRAKLT